MSAHAALKLDCSDTNWDVADATLPPPVSLPEFDRVVIDTMATVRVLEGSAYLLASSDARPAEFALEFRVDDGVLSIVDHPEAPAAGCTVEIHAPCVSSVFNRGDGAVRVHVARKRSKLSLTNRAGGSIVAHGRVSTLAATLTGDGDMPLQELTAAFACLTNHGAGTLTATVSRSVRMESTADGRIRLNPHLKAVAPPVRAVPTPGGYRGKPRR